MKSKALPWKKSNPSKYNPAKQDFIHHRWISPVEDGFDCVFSVKDNTLTAGACGFDSGMGNKPSESGENPA